MASGRRFWGKSQQPTRSTGPTLRARLKELFMPAPTGSWGSFFLGTPRSDYQYGRDLGDGLTSSVIMPVIQWFQRSFPEAPLVVRRRQADALEIVDNHPLVQLVDRPNAFYPGTLLWMVTLSDWCWFGESYWRILRTFGGEPGELWWLPPWSIEPRWPKDGSVFLTHYDYHPDAGTTIRLERDEVLHFRHGLDPRNPRHGLPPLRAVLTDIWADQESSVWVGSLLRNMAVPGMILSPKADAFVSPEEVERVHHYVRGRFTGDHRGEPMAIGAPIDVSRLSWSPTEMDLTVVRNTAEERVTAALGIPAAVVGFHAGLDSTKVGATMHEFIRLAWGNGLIPLQRLLAAELQRVLLPQFESSPEGFLVGWNYDEVSALEPDQNALAERYTKLVAGGILKVSEARGALGYDSEADDEIYLRPSSLTPTDPKDQMPEPEPVAALPTGVMNGNGNGRRALPAAEQRDFKQGTLEEWVTERIGRFAERMTPPPRTYLRLATRQMRETERVQRRYEGPVADVLQRYGAVAALAASEILRPEKQHLEDIVKMMIIRERLPMNAVRVELGTLYQQLYDDMADAFLTLMRQDQDLEPTDPARIHTALRMVAQDRTRLLDLDGDARDGILRSLEEARDQGLDEEAMIDLIKTRVPSGRWSSPEMRAQQIVRNETRMAGNLASAESAQQMGGRVLILDALLGPTDEICESRNGLVVNASEARMLAGVEHPSGTLTTLVLSPQGVARVGTGVTSA